MSMLLLRLCLLVVLTLTLAASFGCTTPAGSTAGDQDSVSRLGLPDASLPGSRLEFAYFHRTERCHSCEYAEKWIRYTLETYFKEELGDGRLVFTSYDVQKAANQPVVKKYKAYAPQFFMNKVSGGNEKITNVMDVWFLIDKDEAFVSYLRTEIEKGLKG